ncbi:Abi-alpha family protein, partial [Enterococcus faecium]
MSDLDPWFNKVPQSTLEKLLNPIAEPIGKGFGGVVSYVMIPFMKLGVISEAKMTNFESKVDTKNSRIPIEERDSSKQGMAFKAVQDSVYQLDSEELQDMFSSLIASSLDSRINQNVLPSFSTILKDLSEDDAVLFKKLYELNAVAKVDIIFTNSNITTTLPVYDDIILLDEEEPLYKPLSI